MIVSITMEEASVFAQMLSVVSNFTQPSDGTATAQRYLPAWQLDKQFDAAIETGFTSTGNHQGN